MHCKELRSLQYGCVLKLEVFFKMGAFSNIQHTRPGIEHGSHQPLGNCINVL